MKFKRRMAAAVCLAGIAFGRPAFADLVFTLTDPNQAGTGGGVLTFMGSLTNMAGDPTATITGYNFNGLPATWTFDDTPFFDNFFLQDIAGGTTLGPLPLFTVTIEAGAAPGIYDDGVFSFVFDSVSGMGQDTNAQEFSVTVVPEPTPLWVLCLGFVSFRLAARLRQSWAEFQKHRSSP